MIIASWNVNGLRSVSTKGFNSWLELYSPDIVALQEIKASTEDVRGLIEAFSKDYIIHLNPAKKKGYSGTAFFIKRSLESKIVSVNYGTKIEKFDDEGRLIWLELDNIIIFNGYFPNGKRDHSRVDFKLEFSRYVFEFAKELYTKNPLKEIIVTGDLNTAHQEIDLANPKANEKTTGFLPIERALVDEILSMGFSDVFRHINPTKSDQYTWWTYRGDCRERNIGWRLDYFIVTKGLLSSVKKIEHQTEVWGSDHCPILLEI